MTEPYTQQSDGSDHLVADTERCAYHELVEVAVSLYHLVRHLQAKFPFLALTPQDEEDLLRATGMLLEWGLLEPDLPDPPAWAAESR